MIDADTEQGAAGPALHADRYRDALKLVATGLNGRSWLQPQEIEALRRELHALADEGQVRFTSSEQLKAESIIGFAFRPTVEACLELWFGKSARTDSEIWSRFGLDVELASDGAYDHWALSPEHPRMLLALILLLDQFRRNMYRNSPQMYEADPRCLALVKAALRAGTIDRLRLIERVFPCLVLTHSESLEDQYLCMREWERVEEELPATDPLRVFREIFQRHVAVIERFGRFPHRNQLLGRASTAAEQGFLDDAEFRFDLPLVRRPDGSFCFQGESQGREAACASGEIVPLSYRGPDAAIAQAEEEIRQQGFARVGDVRLHKFIVERPAPAIGSEGYEQLLAGLRRSGDALRQLWPRITFVESYVCDDKMFCVYMADSPETLRKHSVLADMPMEAAHRVRRIIDPALIDELA